MQTCVSAGQHTRARLTFLSAETIYRQTGSQPVLPPQRAGQRLRGKRGSAADPSNLIQIMLAKGTDFPAQIPERLVQPITRRRDENRPAPKNSRRDLRIRCFLAYDL
jgi:hypothetical protein